MELVKWYHRVCRSAQKSSFGKNLLDIERPGGDGARGGGGGGGGGDSKITKGTGVTPLLSLKLLSLILV